MYQHVTDDTVDTIMLSLF